MSRAWLISEEGYTGRVAGERRKSKVVAVLGPGTTREAVKFLVERLLAINELSPSEQLAEVVEGKTALSVEGEWGELGEFRAGYDPWFHARVVENLQVAGEFPKEEFSWTELQR